MSKNLRNYGAVGLLILVLVLLPLGIDRQDVLNTLVVILIYVTLAQSWNILGGYAGQVNLGHAAFFGVGTLVTRVLWIQGLPFFLSLLFGGVLATLLALVIGLPAFRLKGVYFSIATLGMAEALRITLGNVLPTVTALPASFIVGYDLVSRYYLSLALAIVTVGVTYFLVKSRLGFGLVAIRENEDAAEATGVNALKHKLIALSLSSFFAGLAGGAFAFYHVSYYYYYPFSATWTFDALLITFVGGVGTVAGPILGAVFYQVLRSELAASLSEGHLLVFGTLFILVVLALPGGLVEVFARVRNLNLVSRIRYSFAAPSASDEA